MKDDIKICRACTEETNGYISLYKPGKICGELIKLADVLNKCTSLNCTEDDGLPAQICNKCMLLASKAYAFRQQCLDADCLLREDYILIDEPSEPEIPVPMKSMPIASHSPRINKVFVSVKNVDDDSIKILSISEETMEEHLEDNDDSNNPDTEDDGLTYVTLMETDNEYEDDEQIEIDEAIINEVETLDEAIEETTETATATEKRKRGRRQILKCTECDKVLSNYGSYKYHMQLHSDKTPFKCGQCGAAFKTKNAYDGHMISHDANNPHTCNLCGKKYRQGASLQNHMRSHNGEKPFVCGICGKGMTQKSGYKKHMLTHTGERPYECEICWKKFRYSSNLIMHKKSHVGEKEFECAECGKKFITKEQLKRHIVIHIEGKSQCTVCNMVFDKPHRLAIHMKKHKDPSIKRCKICNREFTDLRELNKHMVEVHSRQHGELILNL